MANTHSSIATDSEATLREVIGEDSTATFENDPTFIDSNPTSNASTENITVQRDTDDTEDSEEEEEDDEEYDEEEEDDDDDDLEDADDEEDEEVDDEAEVALTAAARA